MDGTLAVELDILFVGIVQQMIKTRSWREDAKQDVWVHVLRKWDRFIPYVEHPAIFRRVMARVCRNFMCTWIGNQRRNFLVFIHERSDTPDTPVAFVDWDEVWSTIDAPALFVAHEWLHGGESAKRARDRCVGMDTVVMVRMEDVANVLGISRSTVSRHLKVFRNAVETHLDHPCTS